MFEARNGQIGLGFGCAFARESEQPAGPVDPRAFEAEFVCRRDVGTQALPHMKDALTRDAELGEVCNSRVEVRPVGLIGTDAFSRDGEVELEIEPAAGTGQRSIVDIAEGANQSPGLQRA